MANAHSGIPFRDTDPSHRFNPPQSTFGFGRRSRPPPMHLNGEIEAENRVPLRFNKLERRESKGGLRAIFTRNNKSERSIVTAVPEETPPVSAFSERSMRTVAETSLPRSISIKRTTTVASETTPATPKAPPKMSRMNLRSKSVKSTTASNKTPVKAAPKASNTNKSGPKSNSPQAPTRTSPAWDPPPLFQAYPQAVKHATLSASSLSADALLRMSNHRRNNSLRDEIAQTQQNGGGLDPTPAIKKTDKAKSKHRRQISGSISKAEWTEKIFVLVTSGYLLQYSGSGSFDRLPEKMLQLGKESVAFASDVIPGKHWVLQISQAMDADGVPAADSRSLLSRLAFRGADYRRTATSLLLVLDSAEEMDSWIAVVRREIEALGGKKHASETGKTKPDEQIMQLHTQPSHRYLVQKDSDQFSNPSSPQSPGFAPLWSVDIQIPPKPEDVASSTIEPQLRPSADQLSTTNSVISHDGQQLESLRDSTNRFSYMSSGQRTLITSQGSSPDSTPIKETFDEFPLKISIEDSRPRPNASAINERRRSMQTLPNPMLEVQTTKNLRPHSTYGPPSRPVRSPSPITPNFSIPNPSAKRYPTPAGPTLTVSPQLRSDIPTIVTTTPTNPQGPITRKTKKAPPIALKVTVTNSVSRAREYPTPTRQSQIFHPAESSFKKVQQVKPAVVDIPDRSPGGSIIPFSETTFPHRKSTLMAPKPAAPLHSEHQFLKRLSSIDRESEKYPEAPRRPPPLLPAEEVFTFLPSSISKSAGEEEPKDSNMEHLSPLPGLINANNQLRRPTSMQIRPTPSSPSHTLKSSPLPPNQSSRSTPTKATTPSSISSPLLRLKREDKMKALANRKSMPALANGPPPAPPPSCALPPLPPPSSSGSMKPPPSPLSQRNSVQV